MKKKLLVLTLVLFAFVAVLGGVVLRAVLAYRATGLALIEEIEGTYSFNGKFLLPEDKQAALFLEPIGRSVLRREELKTLSLDSCGLDGTFSYFESNGLWYCPDEGYEGFWPVCGEDRTVVLLPNGQKVQVLPKQGRAYPLFADSIDGVDPDGVGILAFSARGSYAASLDGAELVLYHTDPTDRSLRVVEKKIVPLASFGTNIRFGAFVNDSQAYLYAESDGDRIVIAVDCAAGVAVSVSRPEEDAAWGEIVSRFYARLLPTEGEADRFVVRNLLLGKDTAMRLPDGVEEAALCTVSPEGAHALLRDEKSGEYYVSTGDRAFSLSSLTGEGESLLESDFLEEKVLFASIRRADGKTVLRTYNICF